MAQKFDWATAQVVDISLPRPIGGEVSRSMVLRLVGIVLVVYPYSSFPRGSVGITPAANIYSTNVQAYFLWSLKGNGYKT